MGDSSSQLAFLLFIPVLTTLWIWVCSAFFACSSELLLILLHPDDRFETSYRLSRVADILQFSRDGMLR